MTDKKTYKRSVKAVWDKVKAVRADRAKLYSPTDIATSADHLADLAEELRGLARQRSALNAMPPEALSATHSPSKRKRKNKTTEE